MPDPPCSSSSSGRAASATASPHEQCGYLEGCWQGECTHVCLCELNVCHREV